MASGSWCPTGFFRKVENNVSVHFIVLNVQKFFRLKPMFSKGPSFVYTLFVIMGLWICAWTWWPGQRQWLCLDQPRLHWSWKRQDLTSQFSSCKFPTVLIWMFFFNFSSIFSSWLQGTSSILALRGNVFHGVVWSRLEVCFIFFSSESSNCFPLEPMFSKGTSFFVLFVCNDGALNLHLHLVALPLSMIMSWPTKST